MLEAERKLQLRTKEREGLDLGSIGGNNNRKRPFKTFVGSRHDQGSLARLNCCRHATLMFVKRLSQLAAPNLGTVVLFRETLRRGCPTKSASELNHELWL
jgi:hypothetical protein